MKNLAFCFAIASTSLVYAADKMDTCARVQGNREVIEKNVCPGEGCKLGEWTAGQSIDVYDKPKGQKKVYSLKAGETFRAMYGENHLQPARIEVLGPPVQKAVEPDVSLKKGDMFFLMTNVGEGVFSACYKGRSFTVDCTTIEDGECKPGPNTWARSFDKRGPTQEWWVKIKAKNGSEGWIRGFGSKIRGRDAFE